MTTSSATCKNVLSIDNLEFGFPGDANRQWIIRGLNLSVRESEIVCVLGASGCGKTTLLNLIAGFVTPRSGTIDIAGGASRKRRIGYIFQEDALFPWCTVKENLMLAAQVVGSSSTPAYEAEMRQYLETFHLDENVMKKFPAQLSGGMRQRVSIIQSLMFNPELLLLDEPFSALDFYTKLHLETEFYHLVKKHGKAAIMVTHDIDEAIAMSDRVLLMSRGGNIVNEFEISIGEGQRVPENVRGTPEFASLYAAIWNELKAVAS